MGCKIVIITLGNVIITRLWYKVCGGYSVTAVVMHTREALACGINMAAKSLVLFAFRVSNRKPTGNLKEVIIWFVPFSLFNVLLLKVMEKIDQMGGGNRKKQGVNSFTLRAFNSGPWLITHTTTHTKTLIGPLAIRFEAGTEWRLAAEVGAHPTAALPDPCRRGIFSNRLCAHAEQVPAPFPHISRHIVKT